MGDVGGDGDGSVRPLVVLDLFCGYGGFSQAFRDRGHVTIGVDIVGPADVLADVRRLPFSASFRPDVILASPYASGPANPTGGSVALRRSRPPSPWITNAWGWPALE